MDALLDIKNATKCYSNFKLDAVSLRVPRGSIVGLIGENGAGKTTLLKAALGLIRIEGEISLLPETPAGRDVRQDLGVVLGAAGLPNVLTVQQVEKIMSATYDRWSRSLFMDYCEKFDIRGDGKIGTLSSGAKMKLALAVALSHRPKLLILDEPAAGLDPIARDALNDMLFEFTREEDHGVLISSHILSDLERICDYIAFLHQGKLLLFEEKDRLLERYGIYRCPEEERKKLPREAVMGLRHTAYGDEVLIDKNLLPNAQTGRTTIEDIMVLMVKGEQR